MRIVIKPAGLIVILFAIGVLAAFAFTKQTVPRKSAPMAVVAMRATPSQVPENLAVNADMSAKGNNGLPEAWGFPWSGRGKVEAHQDDTEGNTAPPSIVIDTHDTDGQGQVAQMIKAKPGERFTVSGFVKAKGSGTFSLAVQFYDAKMSPVGFEHVDFAKPGESWTRVGKSISVPQSAVSLGVIIYADGKGKGWIDDISVTRGM
ncbi:MAG: hypothetical protein H8F28_15555 [Fibrella sp.]|nr:hypothetical protein [Armatimonadota bacterium]